MMRKPRFFARVALFTTSAGPPQPPSGFTQTRKRIELMPQPWSTCRQSRCVPAELKNLIPLASIWESQPTSEPLAKMAARTERTGRRAMTKAKQSFAHKPDGVLSDDMGFRGLGFVPAET